MKSGMKMMAVNEMRRRRDSRGRFMEGGGGGQMEMGYSRMEGGQGNYNRMEGGGGRNRMEGGGGSARMGGYDRMESDMRGGGGRMEGDMRRGGMESEMRGGRMEAEMRGGRGGGGNRSEGGNSNRMEEGGASGGYWPGPHMPPYGYPESEMRGGNQNEMNMRPGRERRQGMEMMDPEYPMDGQNVVNIRDYQERRRIGFGANMHYDHNGKMPEHKMMHGGSEYQMSEYPMMEQLTEEIATAWVSKLKNTDPEHPTGPKWSRESTKALAMKHGFNTPEKQLEFWVVMNMMYSDYAETAKKHGVSTMDFFSDMAKAWMKDKDAVEHKTAAYIACCTE